MSVEEKEAFSVKLSRLSWRFEQRAGLIERAGGINWLKTEGYRLMATALLAVALFVSLPGGILGWRDK